MQIIETGIRESLDMRIFKKQKAIEKSEIADIADFKSKLKLDLEWER